MKRLSTLTISLCLWSTSGVAEAKKTTTFVTSIEGAQIEVVAAPTRVGFTGEVKCSYLQNGSSMWKPDRLASRLEMAAQAAEERRSEVIVENDRSAASSYDPMMSGMSQVCSLELASVGGVVEITTWGTFQKSASVTFTPEATRELAAWLRASML